ncbi:MAG: hypothetical protein DWP95_06110 [Proteobacteria bacterium]|nr:MAG: hypothetical protein DWP95_06110 [Pseudomonadota bacterium]
MKAIKYLFFTLLIIVVLMFAYGYFFLPDKVQVSRSITIERPAKAVFKTVNSMHHFNDWSPWAKLDADAKYQYSGPEYGVGSHMAWQGNDEVGSGQQTIIESKPHELVKAELFFDGQSDDPAWASYVIKDMGESSEISWVFDVDFKGSVIGRYFGMMMDRMLGPSYEEGLSNLKSLVESKPVYDFSNFSIETVPAQTILFISTEGRSDQDISAIMGEAYTTITDFMQQNDIQFDGMPLAITRSWTNELWVFDAAIPVDITAIEGETGDIKLGQTYAGKVVKYVQVGPYDQAELSYPLIDAYLAEHELQQNGDSWEVYVNDPTTVSEDAIITHIYHPIQ